jgi:hypothetical protein
MEQFSTARRPTVAGVTSRPSARHRGDDAGNIRAVELPLIGEKTGAGDGDRKRNGAASQHSLIGRLRRDDRGLGFNLGEEGAKQHSGRKQRHARFHNGEF